MQRIVLFFCTLCCEGAGAAAGPAGVVRGLWGAFPHAVAKGAGQGGRTKILGAARRKCRISQQREHLRG